MIIATGALAFARGAFLLFSVVTVMTSLSELEHGGVLHDVVEDVTARVIAFRYD